MPVQAHTRARCPRTIAVTHYSQERWEAFRESVIIPAMQAGVEGGFASAPEETAFEIHSEG